MSKPSAALVPTHTDDRIIESVKKLVIDSLATPNSRAAYGFALDKFIRWYRTEWCSAFNKAAVHAFRTHMQQKGFAPSTINSRLAAVRKLAFEAADSGYISHELAAAIGRVKRLPARGTRVGFWLDKNQAMELLKLPDTSTLTGARDYAMLCVLLGCGLRRQEIMDLTWSHIQLRDGRWCIVDLLGKGFRTRTIAMPLWAKKALDAYAKAAEIDQAGLVFRQLRTWQKRREGRPLSTMRVYQIVKQYGAKLNLPLKTHDLRKSFAKLAHKGNAPMVQIQKSLGHSHLITTELYVNADQNLVDAPCDHLGIDPLGDAEPATKEVAPVRDVSDAARAMQKRAQQAFLENTTPAQRRTNASKAGSALWNNLSPEQRSELAKKHNASRTPEQRSNAASQAATQKWAQMTPEQRRDAMEPATRALRKKRGEQ